MERTEKKHKILIADDHPATRTLLQDILGSDYTLLMACDGNEALSIVREQADIDLVLLDIIMPHINGYEVCRQLKENPATREIPVIFLTVMNEESDEAKGFAAGVADYIVKPISRLRLKTRIANQLQLLEQKQLLHKKNLELQEAMDQIKTLRGILPICSFCKQIRNDQGYWQQVEEYLKYHTNAQFSHGVCPDCLKKHYSEVISQSDE